MCHHRRHGPRSCPPVLLTSDHPVDGEGLKPRWSTPLIARSSSGFPPDEHNMPWNKSKIAVFAHFVFMTLCAK